MEAGPELDALVAERVMGWHRHPDPQHHQWCQTVDGGIRLLSHCEPEYGVSPWQPSTDITAAWTVFDRMVGHVERRGHPILGEEWLAVLWHSGQAGRAYARTAPHAICLAALAALKIELPAGSPAGQENR